MVHGQTAGSMVTLIPAPGFSLLPLSSNARVFIADVPSCLGNPGVVPGNTSHRQH